MMLSVVCAVILHEGKVLITQRPAHKSNPLKWEFPGGKVEPGESQQDALVREIKEELSIDIHPVAALGPAVSLRDISLSAWRCLYAGGSIQLNEHSNCRWVAVASVGKYDLSDADILLLPYLAQLG